MPHQGAEQVNLVHSLDQQEPVLVQFELWVLTVNFFVLYH